MENGIVLTIMEASELVDNLVSTLDSIQEKIGEPQLIIGCDCFLRRMECELKGCSDEVSTLLQKHNVIGFNTYGEQMEGLHINQTFTAVAIGRNRNE